MTDYILRTIDPDLWARFKVAVARENARRVAEGQWDLTLRAKLMELIAEYVKGTED